MKKVLKVVINILLWALLIFAFLVTLIVFTSDRNNGVPKFLGFSPLTVRTGSMSPTFEEDDIIIVKEIDDLYKLEEGDVITFYTIIEGKRQLNTHRIKEIVKTESDISFITKGDYNSRQDDLQAYSSDIVGKWTGIRLKGWGKAMDFLQTKKGFFICILLPMILFFLFELYKFIVALVAYKRPEKVELDEEEIKRKAIEEYLAAQKAASGETDGTKQTEEGKTKNAEAKEDAPEASPEEKEE